MSKDMKALIIGLASGIFVFFALGIAASQYSDYRAAAQSSGWMGDLQKTQKTIEGNIISRQTTNSSGQGVAAPDFGKNAPAHFEIRNDGVIIAHGGSAGQILVLIPELQNGAVVWSCFGGSSKDVPMRCRPREKR
ncbi:hypothetical protein [Arenimonas oryziterrae]|uniref:Pilin n=1 Tax=Arenimonas oryziterrae DSM 21050 = YC6267 TaxID=1121015 RepID=A0A091AUG6_9GAMM|nr:hypothetical protein [Arenimonas oryziterrae]KFN42872.1 hypothetical protein N789_12140 [Arenimonas oryziterrae DSM 21050 = YC6267]